MYFNFLFSLKMFIIRISGIYMNENSLLYEQAINFYFSILFKKNMFAIWTSGISI